MTAYASNSCCGFARDADRAMVGGVCAGLARHFGFNLRATRLLALLAFFMAMPFFVVAYIIAVILVPSESYRDEYIVERVVRRRRHRRSSRRERREADEHARQQAEEQVAARARELEERLARIEKRVTSSRYRLEEEFEKL